MSLGTELLILQAGVATGGFTTLTSLTQNRSRNFHFKSGGVAQALQEQMSGTSVEPFFQSGNSSSRQTDPLKRLPANQQASRPTEKGAVNGNINTGVL